MEYTINMSEYPEDALIHPTAVIGPDVEIGEGTYIGPFCVIGFPAEHKGFWGKGVGKVIIGKNCRITGHVTIDAGTDEITTVGDDVWMLKHSHVGHDAIIGNNVTISCGAKVGGHCIVMDNSNLGLNCSIHQRVMIPSHTMIGMGAVVTKTFPSSKAGRKYAGVPAKDIGPNVIK